VGDPAAAERHQVLGGEAGAVLVVGEDGEVAGVVGLAVHVHDRDRDLAGERGAQVVGVAEEHEAVDLAGEQRADVVLPADRVAARVAEQHGHLAVGERVLDAEQDRDGEAAGELVGQQADGAGAAGQEAAGQRVGLERELVGRLEHPAAGLRRDLVAGVERLGRGGHRHARAASHVGQRDRSGTLPGHRNPFVRRFVGGYTKTPLTALQRHR
jgi:hypothetical protein